MGLQELLFEIDSRLGQEEFQALKFLCMDLISHKKLEKMKSTLDLFDELRREEALTEDNLFIVMELLYLIGHHSLLKKLNTNRKIMENALKEERCISFYRRMLFKLSENIATDDLRQIVFLLNLPNKRTENKTFLDILCSLEKNDEITKDNLDVLENAIRIISPDLLKLIDRYKDYRDSVRASAPEEHELEDLPKPQLSVQVVSSTNMELPTDGLDAENHMAALSLEDQAASNSSEVDIQNSWQVYRMNRKYRGYCLIINNSNFMRSDPRLGTEKDAACLENVFTWLGFEVMIKKEMSAQDITALMKDFQSKDHSDRDCFVCCILTHGSSGVVFGTDNEVLNIRSIISSFSSSNCQTLAGKPKLFFIQACQGQSNQNSHVIEADAVSSPDDHKSTTTIAEDADVLIGMATVDGHFSYRHTRDGSWYIQALCSNLIKMVPRGEDILSILTQVNKDVSEKEYRERKKGLLKQMPQPSYTLRKKLIFPKPPTGFEERL
ncbi:caspase-8-like [Gastrophryne carolinensis]